MRDTLAVGIQQRTRKLFGITEDLIGRNHVACRLKRMKVVLQGSAGKVFGDNKLMRVRFAEIVNPCKVGVSQREELADIVGLDGIGNPDGNPTSGLGVARLIYGSA